MRPLTSARTAISCQENLSFKMRKDQIFEAVPENRNLMTPSYVSFVAVSQKSLLRRLKRNGDTRLWPE